MITCHIVIEGHTEPVPMILPTIPSIGSVIARSSDPKSEHYLVKCVEYVHGHDTVNLHIQAFPNQISAVNAIDGFRNNR
ncbi:hypothetical protein GCM10011510_04640 [Streptococcus himalayensis]|uniref:Uncharacterized protein n=1 Tax=Streptococcus himalayensis TaxID=1888195 RepID=A0A917A4I9_9STRE|nr:hypothetical protein GCM10011510_04640 [Streptococcus himalayensis]